MLLAVVVLLFGYLFQAMRWRRVANVSQPGLRRFYEMVICGLACNNVLPVRIGELLRAGWLSREAPMPGGRALGTVALDRVCDVVTLAVLLVIGIQAVPTPDWLKRIVIGALLALVFLAAALVFARWYTRTRERDRRTRSRFRRIVRDTIDMLEAGGRRRAAAGGWVERGRMEPRHRRGVPRRPRGWIDLARSTRCSSHPCSPSASRYRRHPGTSARTSGSVSRRSVFSTFR